LIILFAFSTVEERDTFACLYSRYKNLLLHKAYEILRDYALAEDAVSEAFIRVYKNLHKIDAPDSPRAAAFLVTIVKNVALTMLRKANQAAHAPYEDFMAEEADPFDLERETLAKISADEIYALVNQLPEELKNVFLLRFAYDMPLREIGKTLGLTENNTAVRLHRARKKLAQLLTKGGYAHEIQ